MHPAVQQREHRVVAGAKPAVFQPTQHLHGLPGGSAQGAVCSGVRQALAAAVRAGVIHQIQCQRVAAGAVQHGLRRLYSFLSAVIYYDTGRKFHRRFPLFLFQSGSAKGIHSSGLMSKLKSSFIRSKLGFMQGSPSASCFAQRFWKRSTSEVKRLRLAGLSSSPRLLLS